MAEVLKLPAYRRLLLAYGLTLVAWAVVEVALAILVYRRTGSALGAAAFFLCTQFVPAFFSPSAVARLDRRSIRRVLPALYVAEAALFVLLAWLVGRIDVGFVLALAFVDGIVVLIVLSLTRAASVGVTAPVGLLREGNALANTVSMVTRLAGPALGGAIVAAVSIRVGLFVGAGMVVLVALTLVTIRGLPEAVSEESPSRGRLAAALRYVRGQPAIRALLSLQAIGLVFFTMSVPVELVLAQRTLHAGAGGYGGLLTAWGGGAIIGSGIFARWRSHSSAMLIALGAALLGGGFVIMAVSPSIAVAAVGAAVGGAGNGVHAVAARTALQEEVKGDWMALVISLNESVSQAFPGVGILLGGALAQVASPRFAFAVAGIGSLVTAVAVSILLRPGAGIIRSGTPPDSAPVGPLTFAGQQRAGYEPVLEETPASPP
jgi:MFS family permease